MPQIWLRGLFTICDKYKTDVNINRSQANVLPAQA